MLERGNVYRFSYLWSWQYAQGEESGRKARPVCLILKTNKKSGNLFLFPLTTTQPPQNRLAIEIPAAERKSAGLDSKSWIILDEYNQASDVYMYDFESTEPLGKFGDRFLRKIADTVKQAILAGRMKAVSRT